MVEPLLYAALGFLMASLFGLFVCRAVWNRAVRLTTQRVQRRLPLSREEIVAGRDLLRAEQAIETRRLERRAEILQARMTASLVDLGRSRATLASLGRDLAENRMTTGTIEAREEELRQQLAESAAELAARATSLAAAEGARDEARRTATNAERERSDMRADLDAKRVEAVALQTDIENLKGRISDLERELSSVYETLSERSSLLSATQDAYSRENARADEAERHARELAASAEAVDPQALSQLRSQIETLANEIARTSALNSEGGNVLPIEGGGSRQSLRAAARAARNPEAAPVAVSTER